MTSSPPDEQPSPAPVDPSTSVDQPPLSKRKQKKLAKQVDWTVLKRDKKHRVQAQKLEERNKRLEGMTEEERTEHRQKSLARIEERRQQRQAETERQKEALKTGQRIVIDLSYSEIQTQSELKSLKTQLNFCYGTNNHTPTPVSLHLTSFGGKLKEEMESIVGFQNWIIETHEQSFLDIYPHNEIVYLTSDSPNSLEVLDKNCVYVIGGMVDHNRLKGRTFEDSSKHNLRTASLPIRKYVDLSARDVLSVNHVFNLLVALLEHEGNWVKALHQTLPPRIIRSVKPEYVHMLGDADVSPPDPDTHTPDVTVTADGGEKMTKTD
ncbi:putative tRNA methyltransferase [Blattamonas nauphoetae]|uniref:tRNA (guanine(9)-N(1))-methyltransferase n=1 Tax=Blattamonas nauphoetae TaxID=2049346 RepID=A0ABQ9X498_9EUKA|nr:putative tRNA methyltransferase [Blattamonas nauphoetae]